MTNHKIPLTMADFHPLPSLTKTTSPAFDALDKEAEKRAKECVEAPMPSVNHLSMKDYNQVYEPSDDTYLLLDGILLAMMESTNEQKPFITLEIGCGTAVPTVFLGMQLEERIPDHKHTHIVTDINPEALRVAQATASANGVSGLMTHECDLASALLPEQQGCIDILLFNPPYVPTPDEEVGSKGIEASWAGGVNGRRVVDRALPQMASLLKKESGVAYMITVDDNLPEQLACVFQELGLKMEPWVRRRARNEYLSVQRISWK
jgi:release factor glutamine methyltransferase